MPRKKEKMGRAANGTGTIRLKTVIRKGKEYTYWEARYTVGIDPGTGKQIQRSVTGKTQKEVAQKLKAALAAIDEGTYTAPSKMTVRQWLDTWVSNYLCDVKPRTADSYRTTVDVHLKAALGAVKLDALTTHEIQQFYNALQQGQGNKQPLSPKTIRNIHGVLHKALQQAVELGHIRNNPATACKLPRVERAEIKPFDSEAIPKLLDAVKGDPYEFVYVVTLFTGMREGEILGLTWDCVDFVNGKVNINKQLQKERRGTGAYHLVSPKNGKKVAGSLPPGAQWMYCVCSGRNRQIGNVLPEKHGNNPTSCLQTRWGIIFPHRRFISISRSWQLRLAVQTQGFTTSAIHTLLRLFKAETTLRRCRPTWATTPPLLHWMYTVMSQRR